MRTRQAVWFGAAVCLVMALAAAPASAQQRSGFWFGIGAGVGSMDVNCDDCGTDDERETSGVAYIQGGWAFSEHLLLGVELNAWAKKFEDDDIGAEAQINIYNALGTLTFYPTNGGFFVKGGAGVAIMDMDLDLEGINATIDMGKGLALVGGVGFDIPVGRVAVTPAVTYWYGATGDMRFMNTPVLSGVRHNAVTATIGIKFP